MWGDVAYGPYGEIYGPNSGTYTFTGQIQEHTFNNLYRFMYREYGTQGRWPSPDPAGTASANPANPQSWNRYAYALNNPLTLIDPLGLWAGPSAWLGTHACYPIDVGEPCGVDDGYPIGSISLPAISACTETDGPEVCVSMPPITLLTGPGSSGCVTGNCDVPQIPSPQTPQQKKAACQAQFQQSISNAQQTRKTDFGLFFFGLGIPGDAALVGCSLSLELGPEATAGCINAVELIFGGPSLTAAFAFEHQYNSSVSAAQSQLLGCLSGADQ